MENDVIKKPADPKVLEKLEYLYAKSGYSLYWEKYYIYRPEKGFRNAFRRYIKIMFWLTVAIIISGIAIGLTANTSVKTTSDMVTLFVLILSCLSVPVLIYSIVWNFKFYLSQKELDDILLEYEQTRSQEKKASIKEDELNDQISKLSDLKKLVDNGTIDEEEFKKLKSRIV